MPLTTPTVLPEFLLPWTWGISSRLLQQSAAAAPYLGRGVSPHSASPDLERGQLHVLPIINSATMNSGIHESFSILVSSGYMARSGIAGSHGGFIPSL